MDNIIHVEDSSGRGPYPTKEYLLKMVEQHDIAEDTSTVHHLLIISDGD